MDRPFPRYRYVAAVLVLLVGLVSAGCSRALLATIVYLVKGNDIAAEFDGLQEKRVVVVCRQPTSLAVRDPDVAADLARELGILLRARVRKIEVIDQGKVNDWTDNHAWEEYTEVGEALGAEMVVGVDLWQFSLLLDQTLYQGKAKAKVAVYDFSDGGKLVFERELPQTVYPPNTPIPTHQQPKSEFRRKFLRVLADQIGRYFYPHDRYADFALDATALD